MTGSGRFQFLCITVLTGLLLFGCFSLAAQEPVLRNQIVIKTARKYKGIKIETVLLTAEGKGLVVKTKDGRGHFLNREEAKQELDITLTDKGFLLPKDASATYYDQNGVPTDNYRNDDYAKSNGKVLTEPIRINPGTDSTRKPLWFINNKEVSKEEAMAMAPEKIESVNVLNSDTAIQRYGEKGKDGVVMVKLKEVTAKDTIPATFPGGITPWRRYIERALRYPQAAQANHIQGVIRVLTTVSETGKITLAKALNDPGGGLAEEAERVIKESPAWIPATVEGKPVPVSFVQRVTFRLS